MRTKVLLPIVFLLAAGLLIMAGCKKADDSTPGTQSPTSMSANLSGAVSGFQIVAVNASESQSTGTFLISAIHPEQSDSVLLTVAFSDSIVLNTPTPITIQNNDGLFFGDSEGQTTPYYAYDTLGHGTITVNSWDHIKLTIAGTFSGVLYNPTLSDSIVVSNGVFNVTYVIGP
jgi:hypothetical protein